MKKLNLNKNLLIAIFLCTTFVIGLQIAEPTFAATYKQFDSGKMQMKKAAKDTSFIKLFKPYVSYKSFTNNKNKIYMDIYMHSSNGIDKNRTARITFTKNKNVISILNKDYVRNSYDKISFKTKVNVKTVYYDFRNGLKKKFAAK